MRTGTYIWLIAKLLLLTLPLAAGASLVSDFSDEDGAPPLWIAPVAGALCFLMGLGVRASSGTPVWTEQQLWLANPFRYFLQPWAREAFHYPPFFHLGALSFIIGGASAFAFAVISRPAMIGHGMLIFSIGLGLWAGIRFRDYRRLRNA